MKWFAALFSVFVLLSIVLANAGKLGLYVSLMYQIPWADKAAHFLFFGILTLVINLSLFRAYPRQSRRLLAVKSGLILALLIGIEEFSQQFFANRTFDLLDLGFGYLGVLNFAVLSIRMKKTRTRVKVLS